MGLGRLARMFSDNQIVDFNLRQRGIREVQISAAREGNVKMLA